MKINRENNIQEALNSIQNIMSRTDFKKMQDDILELTEAELITRDKNDKNTDNELCNANSTKSSNIQNENLTEDIQNAYLERIVKNLLRPELVRWLNANLPGIVERIVEREIKLLMPNKD